MTGASFTTETRRLAYDQTAGYGPGIVFLCGFNSTKSGTKAVFLEDWAKKQGRAFLRFDYSGHGLSSGTFEEGTISRWAEDAAAIIRGLTKGPQIIVGSSMGGWIALLLARQFGDRFAGLITIAAAPDFTEDVFHRRLGSSERALLETQGFVDVESIYGDGPYRITRNLIEDGKRNLVLHAPMKLPFPVRILQGSDDEAVPCATAEKLFATLDGPDIRMTVVKNADHRFSSSACLDLIRRTIEEIPPSEGDKP